MTIIKKNIIEILILFGVLMILTISSDPVLYPDSNRFLNASLHDPPLYSSIISLMQFIFGSLNSVVFLQTLLIGFSIIFFTKTVEIYFNLNTISKSIVSFFLFLPILQFYNNLLTEPISYSLSLLFVSFVTRLIYNFNNQNLFWSSFFVITLLLTRNQFIFLYLVILLLYVGIFILYRSKKPFSLLLISFLSIFIFHNSFINLNKFIKEDTFENKNFLNSDKGIFFFTYIDAIYISSEKDVDLFKNQNFQKTLSVIFKEMNDRKSLSAHYNSRGHFSLSLKNIRDFSEILLDDLAVKENTTVTELKRNISITLISSNFDKYFKHIFKKFYDSTWLFVFIPFFMLLASLIEFFKNKSNFSLLIIFLSTFALANHSVVYLFGRVQPRYLIYTDFILLIFIFIIFSFFLKKKRKKIV